ncbi:MAG TPA: GDSL-type esterase/lipase family protein [Stellaceae bacterium]|nr:GDSL-type esterase/lipase family protein [Stellaceae bacterium]
MTLLRFRFRAIPAAFLFALFLGPPVSALRAAETVGAECVATPELIQDDPRFPKLAQRLKSKEPVTIVAIGGSSTVGTAAGGGDAAYPHQLETILRSRYPDVKIMVLNRGAVRETAQQMEARLERDVIAEKPDLVIWEVGITDAVRVSELDAFAAALQSGIARLQAAGIEVMLVDMQYSPDTETVTNFAPYLDAVHQAGDIADAYVFQRYAIMKHWSEVGSFKLSGVPKEDRPKLATRVYACLGERIADAIAYATR